MKKKPKKTGTNTGAPLCKLCKHHHWNREPCRFESKKPKRRDRDE